MSSTIAAQEIDIFADEVLLDPYPVMSALRDQAGVVHLPVNDMWVLTRYDVIRAAMGDPETFSSAKVAFNDDMNAALKGTTLTTDPPAHQPLRKVLIKPLTPRALKTLKDDIEVKADQVVAELVERGEFDAASDLAKSLPLQVVADLIGLQGEARDNVLRWGNAAFNVLGPMNPRTGEHFPIAGELFGWVTDLTADQLAEGSVGRDIFAAAERGEIPAESANKIIHQYVAAGMDTTISSIGHAINLLGRHPEQYQLLRSNPDELVLAAFNETLRFESPLHIFGRVTTREVEVEGVRIPEGGRVGLLFPAGNRDPRHYDDADSYLIERNPMDHLSFGYGTHTCAGQNLARLQATAVLTAWVNRVASFEVGEATRHLNNFTRSLATAPVVSVRPA